MDTWIDDVRQALRRLAQTPGFTAVALLTLALGIGSSTAVFTIVNQSILRPFSYPDMDRLVLLGERFNSQPMSVAWQNFQDWKAHQTVFDEIGIYRNAAATLTGQDHPERLTGAVVSASVFASMGIPPLAGRVFVDADDRPGSARAAIISERLWRTHFAARSDIVGSTIVLNGDPHTIVGVMPAAMRFPSRLTDVWTSLGPVVPTLPTSRGNHPGLNGIARLKPGVSLEGAQSAMELIAERLSALYPASNGHTHVVITSYREAVVAGVRPAFQLLAGAVALVLLIACANLASLMLARTDVRRRELAVRAALGASRGRLVRHLLTEAATLAAAGGALGALLAFWLVRVFVAARPATVPRVDLIGVDWRVLLFAAGLATITGLTFGCAPALSASIVDVQPALRTGRDAAAMGNRRLRRVLVVAEIAVAFVLLVGAGLFGRSLAGLLTLDLGFAPAHLVTMQVALPQASYPTTEAWSAFHQMLLEKLPATPGIESVALSSNLPLSGNSTESALLREGDPMPTPDHPPAECSFTVVSADYFRTMSIALLRGRGFTARDLADAPLVAVIDDVAAARLFPGADAIGRRISFEARGDFHGGGPPPVPIWREVVGVVHHVRQYGLTGEPPYLQVFTPIGQLPIYMRERRPAMSLVVRTSGPADAVVSDVRHAVQAIDPDVPVYGVQPLATAIDGATEQPRLSLMVVGAFAVLALVLAVVGVYGVLAQNVAQRTREIGVRMALGARGSQIGRLVARQAAVLVALGLAIGVAGAVAASRFVRALLFQVSPIDPLTLTAMAAVLAVTAAVAAGIPARRAARLDPLRALRED